MSGRVLYLDLVGGAAGDMLMASLLDAGASADAVRAAINALGLAEVELVTRVAHPAGLRALQADVIVRGVLGDSVPVPGGRDHLAPEGHAHDAGHRAWTEIRRLLTTAALSDRVRSIALAAFERLAWAEGEAHGVPVEQVVFHEVGADDAIVDIVGVATCVVSLGVDRVIVSPVPLGRGVIRGAHGPIPLPGPATLALLEGAPTVGVPLEGETVTPTGAALVTVLADGYGDAPPMMLERVGVGAGHRTWPDRPNVVRALVGATSPVAGVASEDEVTVEANLDDLTPELAADLEAALFAAGAADVWITPIRMKKGRPGFTVSALGRATLADVLATTFFAHGTTLGVRLQPIRRLRVERREERVVTEFGVVRVKRSPRPVGGDLVKPEHDDCARLAAEHGVPVRVVVEAALRAAWAVGAGAR